MTLDELITHLGKTGELPAEFLAQQKSLIIFFSKLLWDEDSTVSFQDYLTDLTTRETAKINPHSGMESHLRVVSTMTGEVVKNVKNALLNGDSLNLRGARSVDPGSLTQFGISFKAILSNKRGITTLLLKENLVDDWGEYENEGFKEKFLIVKSAKVALMYFLANIVKPGHSIPVNLTGNQMLACTIAHLGFTSYYGFFTLIRSRSDPNVAIRPLNGLNKTRVYAQDMNYVLNKYSISTLMKILEQTDPALFGRHLGRARVKGDEGQAYKKRLVRILRRL